MDKKTSTGRGVAVVPDHLPKERLEYKQLLALNPNYFGNLAESKFEPVQKMSGNITYEQVTCLSFNSPLNLLEATIQIKLPTGYLGELCDAGSREYVRFYIDYGAGWTDLGLTSFNIHDIPNQVDCAQQADKPLSYVVSLQIDPKSDLCSQPVLPLIRAILSWENIPPANQPDWPPPWGNVLDQHIQIKPRPLEWGDIVKALGPEGLKKFPSLINAVHTSPIPLHDPPPLKLAQLAELYTEKTTAKSPKVANLVVPQTHRYGFTHIQNALSQNNQEAVLNAMAEWKGLGINWAETVIALEKTQADVTYEELTCLGLEYNLDRLVATFRVKQPQGYSGGLCTTGSTEFVAFWADWDNTCKWTYLNTIKVNVYDISSIPASGLTYCAILPVDLNAVRRLCKEPKIGRIRAVLSWNMPPSTTDPDLLNHWGNRLDAHVQIRPGQPIGENQPVISVIGGIGIADINVSGNGMTKAGATFAFGGSPADPWLINRECPFGGLIIVQGPPLVNSKYRLWVRQFGDPLTEQIIKNPFHVVNQFGVGSNITPDPTTGYTVYMDTLANINQVLAHWIPLGNELWEVRLELATMAEVILGSTPWYGIQLDNKAPVRRPPLPPYEPPEVTCEIHIDSGGDCKDFVIGTGSKITGHFVARDEHFGIFSLTTLPSSMLPVDPTTSTPKTSQTVTFAAGGDTWELDTSHMKPCGYVVLLQIWDRTILNSVPGQHNYNYYDVGFCLRV